MARQGSSTFLVLLMVSALAFTTALGQKFEREEKVEAAGATEVRLPLCQKLNGIDGYLELRQDVRLTPKLSGLLWGTGGVNIDDDPHLAVFKSEPLRNTILEVVDRSAKVMESKTLERPLAKLRAVHLYDDSRLTYLLSVDYSAGFGSYNGPITGLLEVKDGHLRWVKSTDVKTGQSEDISLMDSIKTTWKIVDAPGGKGKQILLAECRPDWTSVIGDPGFTTTYARFYFDGAKWLVRERKVKGISEFDQGFPSRKEFP